MTGQRVVITGGAGFLGSHLCERLLADGYEVTALDCFITGDPKNVAHLEGPNFKLETHNVLQPIYTMDRIDLVMHLASPASPPQYLAKPIETLGTGSVGTKNALDLAKYYDATFVLASSSEVYGDPEVHPQSEDYRGNVSPTGPRSVYDEAKRFSEALTMAYHRTFGVDTRIARIFNTYGPRLAPSDGRVVSNLMIQALKGQPLTIYGTGEQTRSFCYVSDLIEGLRVVAEDGDAEPINLGNPHERSIKDLARNILRITGSSSEIQYRPLPEDDPKRRRPNIARAQELGWEPKVSLEIGLKRTAEYYRTIV